MKKILILLNIILLVGVLSGCTFMELFTENTDDTTVLATTNEITTNITTKTFNKDEILSEVYARIYQDLYDEVKQEVIDNISEERFDEIYSSILSQLIQKIDDGDITVTAEMIVDMIKNVEESSAQAVVGVTSLNEYGIRMSIGSGVIYKQVGNKYYIVTNHHVVEDGTSFEVRFADGSTKEAILQGSDSLVDLAVLYFFSDESLEVAHFGDSDLTEKGDIILAVGNPYGYDYFGSMTMGIVSGINRYFDIDNDGVNDMFVNYIQHDASINSGNSGGALFNIYGDVIGINVIKISATDIEGMGFAIPSNLVSAICNDIEEFGYSKQKPVLGINFVSIAGNENYFDYYGITIPEEITYGFYINEVIEGSTLYNYVQPGDILVEIAGIELTSAEDFVLYFSQYIVGDIISITLYRNGKYITINNIELLASVEG
ncbi:MAG: hypothetical protein B6I17_02650 [Tenericutes bacterium 4572_104]|nr:MAG: hypothetical protein B6I17_02650 [Tenericutes bacterium 4572_104]